MTTSRHSPAPGLPPAAAAALERMTDAELSVPSRLGHVALLLSALTMTGVVGTLWATEPALPLRVHIAFAVIVAIGVSWVAFAIWVLTHRRILFARHRIVSGRMAVTFTSVFVVAMLVLGYTTGRSEPYSAAAFGVVMLGGAITMLVRAHRSYARLAERRNALARQSEGAGR
jgi:nitrate reductase gamma subunit